MYKAHHDFEPEEPTDIRLKAGDILTNVEYLDNGWSIGYNVFTKEAGIFPRRYVRAIQEQYFAIFPPKKPKLRIECPQEKVEDYVTSAEIAEGPGRLNITAFKQAYNKVMFTKRNEHPILKAVVGAIIGLLLGGVTVIGCLFALEYDIIVSVVIGLIVAFILAIGLAFSTKCRAIVALCIPTLCTKSGRLMFSTFALALLLSGPIQNITDNASELAAVSGCVGEVVSNSTAVIEQLARGPYEQLAKGIKQTFAEVRKSLRTLEDALKPVDDLLQLVSDTVGTVNQELQKISDRCVKDLTDANRKCRSDTETAANECISFVNSASRSIKCGISNNDPLSCPASVNARNLCQSILNNNICGIISNIDSACDLDVASISTQNIVEALQRVRETFSTQVNITDTVTGGVHSNSSAEVIKNKIRETIEQRTNIIRVIIYWMNRAASLIVLVVVIQAYLYLRRFIKDDKHDNRYITEEFLYVDSKRRQKGKMHIMPLFDNEKKYVTDARQCSLSRYERKTFCKGFLPLLLKILVGATIILFDYCLFWAIELVQDNGDIKIGFNQDIDIGIRVEDGGLLSKYLQSLIGNLNTQSKLNVTIDFSVCVPTGSEPNMAKIIGLCVIYLFLVMTVLVQAYLLRLRNKIARYYYPERARDRVKQLHRKLLRQRVVTLKEIKDVLKVKREELEQKEMAKDCMDDLKSSLGCYNYKDECFICGKPELSDPQYSGLAKCKICNSFFCDDCFENRLCERCPCDPYVSFTYEHVTDSDFEEDIQEAIVQEYCYTAEVQEQEKVEDWRMKRRSVLDRQMSLL